MSAVPVLLVPAAAGETARGAAFDGSAGAWPAGAAVLCVAAGVAPCVVDVLDVLVVVVVVVQVAWAVDAEVPAAFGSVAVGLVLVQVVWVIVAVFTETDAVAVDAVGAVDVVV